MTDVIKTNIIEELNRKLTNKNTLQTIQEMCYTISRGLVKSCDISEDIDCVNDKEYEYSDAYYEISNAISKALDFNGTVTEPLFTNIILTGKEYMRKLGLTPANQSVSFDDFESLQTDFWTFPISEIDEIIDHETPVALVIFNDEIRWGELND